MQRHPGRKHLLTGPSLPRQDYLALRDAPGRPDGFPAADPPSWRLYKSAAHLLSDYTGRTAAADKVDGLAANKDAA